MHLVQCAATTTTTASARQLTLSHAPALCLSSCPFSFGRRDLGWPPCGPQAFCGINSCGCKSVRFDEVVAVFCLAQALAWGIHILMDLAVSVPACLSLSVCLSLSLPPSPSVYIIYIWIDLDFVYPPITVRLPQSLSL